MPFITGMAPVLSFAARLSAVLGKIFLPFTILKGLFDFFSSASEEYQDSGSIINAITAGIGGAIGGFFGILLDLPKILSVGCLRLSLVKVILFQPHWIHSRSQM